MHAVGAFREDGYGFMFDEGGNYFVTPPLGSSPVTVWYMAGLVRLSPLLFNPPSDLTARFQLSDQTFAASFTGSGRTGSVDLRRSPSSATSSLLPSGEWQGVNLSRYDFDTMSINMAADGSFKGEALGCQFSGILTPVHPGENLYDADTETAGCSGFSSAGEGHFRGLGYLSDKDEFDLFGKSPGTYFYLGVSVSDAVRNNPGQFLAMEFKVQ